MKANKSKAISDVAEARANDLVGSLGEDRAPPINGATVKTNGATSTTSTTEEPTSTTPQIKYDDAVREGRKIVDQANRGWWRLGQIADQLQPKYGDKTLERFAAAIGIKFDTLARFRDVYRAWKEIPAPERDSVSYSVRKELATLPHRAQIVRDQPTITKLQAAKIARGYAQEQRVKAERAKPPPTADEVWDRFQADRLEDVRKLMENRERWQKPHIPPLPAGRRVSEKLLKDLKRAEEFLAEVRATLEKLDHDRAPAVEPLQEAA